MGSDTRHCSVPLFWNVRYSVLDNRLLDPVPGIGVARIRPCKERKDPAHCPAPPPPPPESHVPAAEGVQHLQRPGAGYWRRVRSRCRESPFLAYLFLFSFSFFPV